MKKRICIATVLVLTALWLGLTVRWLHVAQAAPLLDIVPVTTTIQAAINAAHDGDVVSIPSGTYIESLTVNKTLTLTGVSSATTIIQAVSGQRVMTVTAGHNLRLENLTVTGGHPAGTAGGGIYLAGGSLQIVNCRIANNSADYGGGVFQTGTSGRVDVTDSRIELNTAVYHGGGLYVDGSAALTNTLVLSNTAGWHGGGLHVQDGRTDLNGGLFSNNRAMGDNGGAVNVNNGISITGTQFISNTAVQDGGGLLQWNSGQQVNVTNAHFERNQSSRDGGGLWAQGNVTVTNGLFISNTADSRNSTGTRGGGVYASSGALLIISSTFRANQVQCSGCSFTYGGGVHVDTARPATVQGSLFETNSGWFGAGLHSAQAITIRGTTFRDNSAGYGGGAYLVDADIQNSDFLRNHAVNKGGGLEADGATSLAGTRFISNTAAFGGGLYLPVAADARLVNNVIADNRASYNGSGLHAEAATLRSWHTTIARNIGGDGSGACLTTNWTGQYGSVAVMTNTILVSQTLGITVTAGNTATLSGVLWFGNAANTSGAGAIAVTNDLTGTPAFAADGYHLTSASKAINAGITAGVATDIDSEPRDAAPDLGADEFRTCWARLNNTPTDYGHVQAAVNASTQPADVVKVAGYCPGVQMRSGITQTVYISKSLTVRGGYGPILAGYWKFDEGSGTTANDSSGYGNLGTVTGATYTSTNKAPTSFPNASALNFVSSTDRVAVPLVTTARDNVTLAAWVNWRGTTGQDQMIVLNGNGAYSGYGLVLWNAQSDHVSLMVSGITFGDSGVALPTGVWQHLALVRAGGVWTVYVNGMPAAPTWTNTPNTPDTGTFIGNDQNSAIRFNGQIDDVRIYNSALSAAQIAALASGNHVMTNWTISDPIANPTTLDAQQGGRVVYLTGGSGVSLTLESLTVQGGLINNNGGGIYDNDANLILSNVIVRDNVAQGFNDGGGVYIYMGKMRVSGGQILRNTADDGGGIFINPGNTTLSNVQILSNTAEIGGGVFINWGSVTLSNAQILGNLVNRTGGGMHVNSAALVVTNTTVSRNQANNPFFGGGAISQSSGHITIINNTIVSNTATVASRSGIWLGGGTLEIGNSIIAHNGITNNVVISGGVFTSLGYNLTNSGTGAPFTATTDLTNTDPLLGPLQDNGGSTWTYALLPNSPAINRIPTGVNGCGTSITTDQRGWPRPFPPGGKCDIGAFEAVFKVYLPLVIK